MRISDWSSDVCSSDLKGAKLIKAQGREGELSELAAFLFDIDWRSRSRPDSAAQRAALGEAERTRATLSADERTRIEAARRQVFADFERHSKAWRALKIGQALVLVDRKSTRLNSSH